MAGPISSSHLRPLEAAGFAIEDVTARTIEASVEDWFEFLSAYHEACSAGSAAR